MQAVASLRSLLLNSSYEPMKVVSWQKALILWLQEKVEVLEFHGAVVRSVRSSFQLPSIIRLKRYVRPKTLGYVRFCRENVYMRDDYTCQYCGTKQPLRELTLDHVVPVSKKGPKSWTNVVTACRHCNQKKGNRTPADAKMPLRKEVKAPTWLPSPELDVGRNHFPDGWVTYLKARA